MRFLHTSDWHLGKRLYKLDRTPEHEMFLDWIIKTILDDKIDVLLIAGDIFDTPTPPHQSLEIFYNFLHRVSVETQAETLIIAGNHDSGLLLEAPSKILSPHRVKVWGKLSETPEDHWYKKGEVEFCCIPFFRSYELMPTGEGDALEIFNRYLEKDKIGPQVLMLHHLAGMYESAGSEQVISLSGVDSIPLDLLKRFDYVALGHIHKPQKISEQSYYSGSPIPMRFSETLKKSVIIGECHENKIITKIVSLPVFRNLFILKTNEKDYKQDIEALTQTSPLMPMVEIQMELKSPRVGLIDELKALLLKKKMELLSYMPLYEARETKEKRSDKLFELSAVELFEEFYQTKYPESSGVPEDLKADFKALLQKVKDATSSP